MTQSAQLLHQSYVEHNAMLMLFIWFLKIANCCIGSVQWPYLCLCVK